MRSKEIRNKNVEQLGLDRAKRDSNLRLYSDPDDKTHSATATAIQAPATTANTFEPANAAATSVCVVSAPAGAALRMPNVP
jgi:hypothetical protein